MIVFVGTAAQQIVPLPPSAKLIYRVLESDGQLTQKDLVERTALPSRTVRYALGRLKEKNLLVKRFSIMDARQSLYSLPGAGGGDNRTA